MNRIAAEYVFTLNEDKPIRNGFGEFASDGTVPAVGEWAEPGRANGCGNGAGGRGFGRRMFGSGA